MADGLDLRSGELNFSKVFSDALMVFNCVPLCKPDEDNKFLGEQLTKIGRSFADGASEEELRVCIADLFSIASLLAWNSGMTRPDDVLALITQRQSTFFRAHLDKLMAG